MEVFVRDNDVNAALRVLKKKMQREGTFREMKLRRSYEKPSDACSRKSRVGPPLPKDAAQAPGTGGILI
jgi:small subunit ribosomal protein S21